MLVTAGVLYIGFELSSIVPGQETPRNNVNIAYTAPPVCGCNYCGGIIVGQYANINIGDLALIPSGQNIAGKATFTKSCSYDSATGYNIITISYALYPQSYITTTITVPSMVQKLSSTPFYVNINNNYANNLQIRLFIRYSYSTPFGVTTRVDTSDKTLVLGNNNLSFIVPGLETGSFIIEAEPALLSSSWGEQVGSYFNCPAPSGWMNGLAKPWCDSVCGPGHTVLCIKPPEIVIVNTLMAVNASTRIYDIIQCVSDADCISPCPGQGMTSYCQLATNTCGFAGKCYNRPEEEDIWSQFWAEFWGWIIVQMGWI